MKLKLRKISLIVLIIYMIMLCGCNQNKQTPEAQAKQVKSNEESDKVPKDLENIESSIEAIIKALEGPAASTKDEGQKEQNQQNQDKPNKSGGQEEDGGNGNKEENEENGEQQRDVKNSEQQKKSQEVNNKTGQEKVVAPKDSWQEISSTINKLHYQWNGYIPSVTKKNARRELIDNFDNALNNLTSTIVTKDKNKTLLAANNLYLFIPDLYMLYKTPTSPEIKRIRFYIRNAVLNGAILNWEQANKDIGNLKATWSIYKNTIDPKNQDLASRLDYSIYELEKVVNEKNTYLTDIKGRIAISNTEGVENAAKENEKNG